MVPEEARKDLRRSQPLDALLRPVVERRTESTQVRRGLHLSGVGGEVLEGREGDATVGTLLEPTRKCRAHVAVNGRRVGGGGGVVAQLGIEPTPILHGRFSGN